MIPELLPAVPDLLLGWAIGAWMGIMLTGALWWVTEYREAVRISNDERGNREGET